ncbi:radical SAM protein [Candidatus Pacearchaeota archaeon]|nr:radical SAM protein [Candidatus Pacearchaeota archaeon]
METEVSKDGTVKFNFVDGYSAVVIPLGEKKTLCLSTQVGCAMGCRFCLSGRRSFERNLSLEELRGQLDAALQHLKIRNEKLEIREKMLADEISSIVFMGMGEPMLNLDSVLAFCDYVNSEYGYAYSRIVISTCGILPGMMRVIEGRNRIQLAVSLHSAFQDIRDLIMPGLVGFSLKDLIEVCHKYNEVYRQKIMIEYVMIEGLTDRDCDLEALIGLGLAKRTNFNLIGLNSSFVLDGVEMKSSSVERMNFFMKRLIGVGYKCFVRSRMGEDIGAACGMLK